jgi:hypothetical protein
MTKAHVVAVVVGLLLAASGPSSAANRISHTHITSAVKSHPPPTHSSRSVNSGSAIHGYGRDPFLYNRDNRNAPLGETWPGNGAM